MKKEYFFNEKILSEVKMRWKLIFTKTAIFRELFMDLNKIYFKLYFECIIHIWRIKREKKKNKFVIQTIEN